jgi:glycosyltransferase involved in cell wall biosynthesis
MTSTSELGTLCIIKGHVPLISETFIDSHIQRLPGEKVVLYNYFPEYVCNGRTVRTYYSQRPLYRRVQRLLPAALYDRWVGRYQHHPDTIRDYLYAFFRQHRVNCILAEYGMNGADITQTARELQIPLVVHFHGHDAHRLPDVLPYRDKYVDMFRYASSLISVSHLMTQTLLQLGAPAEKIVYNPYGAREYFFQIQPDYRPTLIAIGRFAEIKAPYLTVAAFREALRSAPDARLVMVGDGHLLECCRSLAMAWGISDRISFLGALTHDQFLPLMSQACAFVQHSVTPTYGDAEGTPNSVLEAQAAGLPVISTRHAGICEAVVHGQTGMLVEERDVHGMAECMVQLLSHPMQARMMGAAARQHIRANYSMDRHLNVLQTALNRAVSGS